jgi:hypothetical protein
MRCSVAATRLLELNRSRWQHLHLRELGGRCSARREGSRVRGRTDGREHVAASFDIYAKELTIVYSVRPLDEAVDAIRGLERDKSTVKVHIQAWR